MEVRLNELYIVSMTLRDRLLQEGKKSGGWQSLCNQVISRPLLQPDEGLGNFRAARKQMLLALKEAVEAELKANR
jgi:hypothetical protein